MEKYNDFIKFKDDETYQSEIVFVKTSNVFNDNFFKDIRFYVTFNDEYKKFNGFYRINNNYDKSNKYVKNTIRSVIYSTYIKIMSDYNKPYLNGKTMLLQYGYELNDMIQYNKNDVFNKIFLLNIKKISMNNNFDHSRFIDNYYSINNFSLNNLKYETSNIPELGSTIRNLTRNDKLQKLKKSVELKNDLNEK